MNSRLNAHLDLLEVLRAKLKTIILVVPDKLRSRDVHADADRSKSSISPQYGGRHNNATTNKFIV